MTIELAILIIGVFVSSGLGAAGAIWWIWNREIIFFREYLDNRESRISTRAGELVSAHVEKYHTIPFGQPHQ